ncbi:MAG: methylated-DNA--[protein]-cysteine S-methyltransferase [Deltaproteobacteria bacterium]|nr:methylated-DNA--[protein]-cysteine S-methyltransferase [Deltaproteobacteria bacterium]MBW2120555.1 methylated-DNA--[protein]-cysteine S-methyltransferase [Deltaproteobacteria bacterium]
MRIRGGFSAIHEVGFCETKGDDEGGRVPSVLLACRDQLDEYFKGVRQSFCLNLEPLGTDFLKLVWSELLQIPYGQTRSYGEIAARIGNGKAFRAVGLANGRNPIEVIIPCHRVVGKRGELVGYGGGLWRKQWLLDHERRASRLACFQE